MQENSVFLFIDWVVIGLYFAVLFGVAWWVIRQKQKTSEDYFLAGRHIGWFVIGASIFASNIGSEHIVGLAGTAAQTGVVMGNYELHSWLVLLLGWVFVPFYMRSKVFTMPEFLEKRYSPKARWILSLIMLIGYVLTKISVTVYAGAVVFQALMGIEFWTGALIIVMLTGLYTVLGGLRAVLYTETLQTGILIAGSVIITLIGLDRIGGWSNLVSIVGPERLSLFLPADHPDFPWTGMVFAPPIIGLWYWCTDQYIVQRTLSAKNETAARQGTIFAGYLKLLPFFIFIIPGVIAYALSQTGQLDLADADQAFPILVKTLLPAGVRGLVAGGLLAALMSSLAAVFNSCSTLFTMDMYQKLKPDSSEETLVRVGRIATGVVVAAGIAWIPLMQNISGQFVPLPAECSGIYRSTDRSNFPFRPVFQTDKCSGSAHCAHRRLYYRYVQITRRIESGCAQRFSVYLRNHQFLTLCHISLSGMCCSLDHGQPANGKTDI